MPPNIGPIMTPMLNVIGRRRNARDWYLRLVFSNSVRLGACGWSLYFFSLTISLILQPCVRTMTQTCGYSPIFGTDMVLITPTLPLVMPPRDLKNKACQNVVEKPNPRQDNTVTSGA